MAAIEASQSMHKTIRLQNIDFELQDSHLISIVTHVVPTTTFSDDDEDDDTFRGSKVKRGDTYTDKNKVPCKIAAIAEDANVSQTVSEKLGVPTANDSNGVDTVKLDAELIERAPKHDEATIPKLNYPIGSVVATAIVHLSGKETLEYFAGSTLGVQDEKIIQTRNVKYSWTFRGCISSHEELSWKIVAFDGFGDISL